MKRQIEFASHPANLSAVRSMVREFAAGAKLPDRDVEMIVLGVDEACANIIRHVYQHEQTCLIGLSCERLEQSVCFRLRDYGAHHSHPTEWAGRALDAVQPGGLGLHLIRSAFDEVDYRREHDGTELILTKHFQAAA